MRRSHEKNKSPIHKIYAVCRIAGLINKTADIRASAIRMRDSMAHGGPDDAGIYCDPSVGFALAHRRLSIIDLTNGGHQPMINDGGNVIIAYNGEVYNYRELKQILTQKGKKFHSSSDTEVILKAYEQWGADCFTMLKGMFAIAIYDKEKQQLILARDPNGIKPLYYYADSNTVCFASEVKAFKKLKPDWQEFENWKAYILVYGYLPEPYTTLTGVYMLPKGSYMCVDVHTISYSITNYNTDVYASNITDEQTAIEEVRNKLNIAVDRHLISDAPIGLFLSGGIDSSLLTLIAKQTGHTDLHTLSIVFDDKHFSEQTYQDIIAEKTKSNHRRFNLDAQIFTNELPDIFRAMDQPTTDGINTYFICKYAKTYGLKAVLSGLGADELFGGYASFGREKMINKLKKIPAIALRAGNLSIKDKYRKLSFLSAKNQVGEYLFHRGYFSTKEAARILGAYEKNIIETIESINIPADIGGWDYGNKVSYLEKNIYMQSQLLKDTDMMSMWHSIEVRVPFLDTDLVSLVNSIAPAIKFSENTPKHLLVKAYADLLPREIWDRKKQGFVFPFQHWMKGNENMYFKVVDKKMTQSYNAGNLSWSRYWAYLITANYQYLQAS
ncbi:asparagine synthase (glutamine-hydrolyzing) [Chitinophagaceae bacterium IBVUCB1]|nr:asparagine synthase (glutamine-hydrolyzing) [Chitinophagaceae bacterium IBVUCB1]